MSAINPILIPYLRGIKDCPNKNDKEFCYNEIHTQGIIALECLSRAWVSAITSGGGASELRSHDTVLNLLKLIVAN